MQATRVGVELPLDKSTSGAPPRVTVREGEAGTTELSVTVSQTAGGEPADLSGCEVYLVGTRPDGAYCEQAMEVADGVASCTLDAAWSAAPGLMRLAYVLVRQGAQLVGTTAGFEMLVQPASDVGATPAEPVAARVDKALEDVKEATDEASKAAERALEIEGRAKAAADKVEAFMASWAVGYDDLTEECRAKVAASASTGAEVATEDDMLEAWDEVVAPAIEGTAAAGDLTPEEYAWALEIVTKEQK